jgi:Flp pilus assembly protein TadG
MLTPLIRRPRRNAEPRSVELRSKERGFTMALVAVSMLAIIAMAALSIDIGTLYEAKAEAQRAADAAALTGARVISISGITGDPGNAANSWPPVCGGASGLATMAAINVAQQNLIGGVSVPTASVTVTYGAGTAGGSSSTCVSVTNFGVNPIVTVKVQRTNLPTFFARVFSLVGGGSSAASVSATASAEVFNPSASGAVASSGSMIPVNPRCVKPWILANVDPAHPSAGFVSATDGSISTLSQGVWEVNGGAIGESFLIGADCTAGAATCTLLSPTPGWNAPPPPQTGFILQYVPALVSVTSPGAVSSCATGALSSDSNYQPAIGGCDQSTTYACGTASGATVDLNENPVSPTGPGGDTATAAACLIGAAPTYGGADILEPGTYPFEIQAEGGSPLFKARVVNSGDLVTTSNSIVTIPIYDNTAPLVPPQPKVTIVGFLQVFINRIDTYGNLNVTVMNVAGCGDAATNQPVAGTSPVPIRLITPP